MQEEFNLDFQKDELHLKFSGELTLYKINNIQSKLSTINLLELKKIYINLDDATFIDTAFSIFIINLKDIYKKKSVEVELLSKNLKILSTINFVEKNKALKTAEVDKDRGTIFSKTGSLFHEYYVGFISFMYFFGELFATKLYYLKSFKHIRFKEIAFEINENAVKAIGIIALTSFLIGLVVAYQSAYQLKIYGANIFIVDMLGLSILRELAPLITAIVIAGRSGSAFTAQIGAMKITQELDAMKTMGFDPFAFLVMPRIIALMISMPILIFIADIMGMFGGMLISSVDLGISSSLFMDRFNEVIAPRHFFLGIIKGPFFAFLIATIGIYRGMVVKDDTQSIGFNTTKSVVESIFAVIVCDAVFSIIFTSFGI